MRIHIYNMHLSIAALPISSVSLSSSACSPSLLACQKLSKVSALFSVFYKVTFENLCLLRSLSLSLLCRLLSFYPPPYNLPAHPAVSSTAPSSARGASPKGRLAPATIERAGRCRQGPPERKSGLNAGGTKGRHESLETICCKREKDDMHLLRSFSSSSAVDRTVSESPTASCPPPACPPAPPSALPALAAAMRARMASRLRSLSPSSAILAAAAAMPHLLSTCLQKLCISPAKLIRRRAGCSS